MGLLFGEGRSHAPWSTYPERSTFLPYHVRYLTLPLRFRCMYTVVRSVLYCTGVSLLEFSVYSEYVGAGTATTACSDKQPG